MNVTPQSVSGRVVKTSISWTSPTGRTSGKRTLAPSERPIQLRCIVSTFSGQPPSSLDRSSSRLWA